jgi:hypothetical protein
MLTLSGKSPNEGDKSVALNSLIEFSILDDGTGLNLSSLVVEVNGARAFQDLDFTAEYDGTFSDITSDSTGAHLVIDALGNFGQGEVVLIKIQIQNLEDAFYNFEYTFKTIPAEPELELSSPLANALVKSDQVLFLQFSDPIDDIDQTSINVYINDLPAVLAGAFQSLFTGSSSAIVKTTNKASVRIEPTEPFRNGPYIVRYEVSDLNGNTLIGRFAYSVDLPEIILPSTFPQIQFLGYAQGIAKVLNMGRGDQLRVYWNKVVSRSYRGDAFALVYENESRLDIFDSNPKYIADKTVTFFDISGLTPSKTLSYAVRAMETFKDTLLLSGMTEKSSGVYLIPTATTVASQVLSTDAIINVASTEGYPSAGILRVNSSEIIRYTSKTSTSFLLPTNGRGLNGTSKGIYVAGDSVEMFFSCQDENTSIVMGTPTYVDGYESGRELDGTGLVVTDYSDNDSTFFQGFDFCGYHRAIPQDILQGKGTSDCGSYLGGEFDGFRGMNLFDRMLNREEVLLDQVGEPVILLRRKWDGETCSCSDPRRMHPKIKSCKSCYGTGYDGGYTQYNYRRRSDGRVMMAFGDTQEDLKLGAHSHLEQAYEPSCWTVPNPAIRDRDLIIRFDFTNDVEFIYEVLNTTKDKLFFRRYTRQRIALKRMDKTDMIYTFPWTLT